MSEETYINFYKNMYDNFEEIYLKNMPNRDISDKKIELETN